ncbi:hypothetical protein QF036_005077 [Arthrobacter globiformis]|nr:hypothetical protein [Arthrobacter globiformis]
MARKLSPWNPRFYPSLNTSYHRIHSKDWPFPPDCPAAGSQLAKLELILPESLSERERQESMFLRVSA